jgi:phosphomethylpyrimidine synthase
MTQIQEAKAGRVTKEMKIVASEEKIDIEVLRRHVADGSVVIAKNRKHDIAKPVGIGQDLRTKVNANVGTSPDSIDIDFEVEKARIAVKVGADTIMDLSTGGELDKIRTTMMDEISVAIGTVPIYEAAITTIRSKGALTKMTFDDIIEVLEKQAEEGVDFFTLHCGVTQSSIERLKRQGRLMDIVSRGGSFLTAWMMANNKENPLYEYFDKILEIAQRYDIILSLGDGMRPGSLIDATDRAQVEELIILGELTKRAWAKNVQVMIEGPGHVPLNQIKTNIQLEKSLCSNAPFYVLGPLVTDVAPGYDHITSAIGGAIAGAAGADFLCYVTPCEHLKLPDLEDVRQGVIASRISAHAADIAKGLPGAINWDIEMSNARKKLDWESQFRLAIDPERARELKSKGKSNSSDVCSMCGEFCAIKLVKETLSP